MENNETILEKLKKTRRSLINLAIVSLMKQKSKYSIVIKNSENLKLLNDKNYIFAINHLSKNDYEIFSMIIKRDFYCLSADDIKKSPYYFLFLLTEAILVDRLSKESRQMAAKKIIDVLNQGYNVMICPEATWNFSPNLLILPLRYGIIDIAKKTNKKICPISLDYYDNECVINIGEPIDFKGLDKKEGIIILRDALATLRYDIWLDRKKDKLPENLLEEYEKKILDAVNEYPVFNFEKEQSTIYRNVTDEKEVFKHLENIEPNLHNAFLYGKNKHKY